MPNIAPLLVSLTVGFTVSAFAAEPANFVNVSGRAEIEVVPDQAFVTCGVNALRKRMDSAVAHSSKVSESIFAISRKYGIDKSDIGTELSELRKEYRVDRDTSTYLGILSQHIYLIKVRNIDSISRFINEMHAHGMNELRNITFTYSKEDSLKRVVSEMAMADALANAKSLVRNQGRTVGKLISASYEKPEGFDVRAEGRFDRMGALWGGEAGPAHRNMTVEYLKILPKKIRVPLTVFAKYEIK